MRTPFTKVAADSNGNVLLSASITVYLAGTSTLATIYSAETGSADSDSVITSDTTNGSFTFWVDDADYNPTQRFKIVISRAGFITQTYDNIAIFPLVNRLITYTSTASATGANTNETTLATLVLPAGTLNKAGRIIKVTAFGATGANGNNKTIWLTFGSTTVVSSGVVAWNNQNWRIKATIMRTGAATQIACGEIFSSTATVTSNASPTETLSGDINVLVKGQNGSAVASDITFAGATMEIVG